MQARPKAAGPRPKISVILPVEPAGSIAAPLRALKALQWPKGSLEVLVCEGREPSRQRNLAAQKANGSWLLFLDSDSVPQADLLEHLFRACRDRKAAVAGGPNLALLDEPWLGRVFSHVLASYFGSLSVRARYRSLGVLRPSSEKELILCNLLVNTACFRQLGGFREDLYPNEENEFLNRMQASGARLLYVPEAIVRRPRRGSLSAFAFQAFRYGRGRMQQMRANFFPGDLLHLIPILGLSYLLGLGLLVALSPWAFVPALLYAVLDLLASLDFLWRTWDFLGALLCIFVFPLRHFAYALGLLAGIIQGSGATTSQHGTRLKRVRL